MFWICKNFFYICCVEVKENKYEKKRLRIAERDGWTCQLCKRPIQCLLSLSIDHIKPRSKGGSDALSNLQAAHKACNGIKSSDEQREPEYYINFVNKTKKKREKREPLRKVATAVREKKEKPVRQPENDEITALYNDIVENKFQNLSFVLFQQHFERYYEKRIMRELEAMY